MTRRIILFRFHQKPAVCRNHLRLLRVLNPDVPIYGMYGGLKKEIASHQRIVGPYLRNFFNVPITNPHWKWRNGDLAFRLWFKTVGHKVDFDIVHVIEWDLVMFEPISQLYRRVPSGAVGLTDLKPLSPGRERAWYWTSHEPYRSEWLLLRKRLRRRYHKRLRLYQTAAVGACFPRIFLERFAQDLVPELGNDELRMPLYTQAFGLPMVDTGLNPRTKDRHYFFNADNWEIDMNLIRKELKKRGGRRAFHPVRRFVPA